MSVLKCPSYRGFSIENVLLSFGESRRVRLTEVSVLRGLTVVIVGKMKIQAYHVPKFPLARPIVFPLAIQIFKHLDSQPILLNNLFNCFAF